MKGTDTTIATLLSALDLKRRGWQVVDHWDAALCAVGIARASEPRRLVYVSTFNQEPGKYYYECELPGGPEDTDYVATDRGEGVTYDELLDILVRHLG